VVQVQGNSRECESRLIGEDELEGYIAEEWEFVANLPGKKAIVRLPL